MKSIKVNADYESVLFFNKPLSVLNESLEFLALYLIDVPLFTKKSYAPYFLDHVESFTGIRPRFVQEGTFKNWWGDLKNIERERELNSKEKSASFDPLSLIIHKISELPDLKEETYLAKTPYGMSGQNFCLVQKNRLENLEIMLKKGAVILEPLFDRIHDFSHYVFPNGQSICYENIIDKKFQYRGTIFNNYTDPSIKNLSFFLNVSELNWGQFESELQSIRDYYYSTECSTGYSVDSFVYRKEGSLFIRALSEVNYRRTMGQVTFELSLKYGGVRKWSALLLCKPSGISFLDLKKKLLPLEWEPSTSRGIILLSPGDVRYDMFFLSAMDKNEGMLLLNELKNLLPNSEFTVEL